MLLTKIQKLLNGERGGRKSRVKLDFWVCVFQQRQEDSHFESYVEMDRPDRDNEIRENATISSPAVLTATQTALLFRRRPHFPSRGHEAEKMN